MKRTSTPRSRPKRARSTTSSSLTPRTSTQLTLTGARPASMAASTPARTCGEHVPSCDGGEAVWAQGVAGNGDPMQAPPVSAVAQGGRGWPHWWSSTAPPGAGRGRATSPGRWARTVGSPPVKRTEVMPKRSTKTLRHPLDFLEGEDLGAREPPHVLLRHAIRAAEVAAVGDRDPQVADLAPKTVDQWDGQVGVKRLADYGCGLRELPGWLPWPGAPRGTGERRGRGLPARGPAPPWPAGSRACCRHRSDHRGTSSRRRARVRRGP